MLEVARRRHDQVAADIRFPEVAEQRVLREAADRLGRAENRATERVVGPVLLGEQLVDQIVGGVLDHLDLLEDHLLLAVDLVGRERRMQHQIREDVERPRQVFVHHLDVVARVFLRREGIEVAAHRVELLRDVLRGATFGALEEHVLDEVGDPALLGRLVARPARQPDAEAHRADVGHGLGDEPDAIRKRVVDDHRQECPLAPTAAAAGRPGNDNHSSREPVFGFRDLGMGEGGPAVPAGHHGRLSGLGDGRAGRQRWRTAGRQR